MKKLQLIIIALFFISFNGFSQKDTAQTKKAFVPSGKIWGQIFGDYTYKLNANTFNMSNTQYTANPKDFNSFDYRRIFLGYDYDITVFYVFNKKGSCLHETLFKIQDSFN